MSDYNISGIQQIGVGTVDFRRSWDWFIRMFGFDVRILEDDTVAERMLPYTGNMPQKRHACIAVNLNGGGGLEIWQYSDRQPEPADFVVAAGDLGIFAAKVKCRDVNAFHTALKAEWPDCGDVSLTPDGTKCFYVKDLYGNMFQIVERRDTFIRQKALTGGIAGAMIGVSDMDASVDFYREVLGYDRVVYDITGTFQDMIFLPGGDRRLRRVLLARSSGASGAFSGLIGDNVIELVQALERAPRKIYEGRFWGDPGFIQICYDVTGMDALGRFCAGKGHPLTVDSCPDGEVFDMGDASGRFTYIEDPDGTLIEFVETYRVPVVRRLGWFIEMNRRGSSGKPDEAKPLPRFLFRVMGWMSRQKI